MNNEIDKRATVAEKVIQDAGKMAMEYFGSLQDLVIESKGLQDRVSEADRNVEKLICDSISREFPMDGFVGEESGTSDKLDDSEFIWVIDPIDGTDNFVHGLPNWCISIALISDGQIQIGMILNPIIPELFIAVRGQGATCNGTKIEVSKVDSVTAGVTGVGFSHRLDSKAPIQALTSLCQAGGVFQRNGSAALTIAYVAAGRYIGFYEAHVNSWDVFAGLLLVEEAGGWSTDFLSNNGLLDGNPLITGCPGIKTELSTICNPIMNL